MTKRMGLALWTLLLGAVFFQTTPVWGCVAASSDTFSAVSATGMTVDWVSFCSTATIQYSQVDDDPAFLSPFTQASFGPPVVFGSTIPLIPNTVYYAQVSTSPSMVGSVLLGSTATFAEIPGVPSIPFSNLSVQGFRLDWTSGTVRWNPPDTLYEAQISTQASFAGGVITQSTIGYHAVFSGLPEGTTFFAQVRAFNRAGVATSFAALGSTHTDTTPTPFNEAGSSGTIQSPDGAVTAVVAAGSLAQDYQLLLSTDPQTAPLGPPELPTQISSAESKLAEAGSPARMPLPGGMAEIRAQDTGGHPLELSSGNILTVTMAYSSTDGETVDLGMGFPVRARTLQVYRLNESKSLWVRLPSAQVDTSARKVTSSSPGFGVFALVGQMDTSLETAFAYPVPFKAKRGDTTITFSDLAQRATIRIFSASGRWVRTLDETDGDGEFVWDVADSDGNPLPSGVYFFLMESSSDRKRGKLVIIR